MSLCQKFVLSHNVDLCKIWLFPDLVSCISEIFVKTSRQLKNSRVHDGCQLPRVRGLWRRRKYTEVPQYTSGSGQERNVWRDRVNNNTVTRSD